MKYLTLPLLLLATSSNLSHADTLAQIKHTGLIKVGTTGDYPPLTVFNKKNQQYSGFAITMAHNLAKNLGVKVKFIHTRWPSLSQDLAANKFDIAMGGHHNY
ncbi:transporter substrate-binding domain-containing protein [Piscirickettsia litoralis]|uniref:transporter substrate-binding domain-containing protein n=1 Tax=Piscirickettsia litoralis TaxID=1891921 RepID=UPI00130191B0|nr:transporter substrate-binding domain-containing protein [Piscirickettsia litoralis]